MKSAHIFRLTLFFVIAMFGAAIVRAEDLGAVKARMEQRLGSVDALKDRGAVGENNQGFLEARGNVSGADQKVISDENADRRTVYADIAAKTGATADTVGRKRAQHIATIAKAGHWIQDAGGAWRQKS